MNKNTESAIAVISAIFVLFTAMIDTQASFIVAVVALVCFVIYKMVYSTKIESVSTVQAKVVPKRKVTKKATKNKSKKK